MDYFCCMRYKFLTLLFLLVIGGSARAQEKWGLLKCIEYAMANNITIKQTDLNTKLAELDLKQSKLGQIPSLNFSGGPSYNSGRSQDPVTYTLSTQSYLSVNVQLQSSADIFNWFSKKNTIAANEWQLLATKANTDKLKNDIALSVANLYLQILLGMEQEKIASVQLQQSQAQLSNTRKLVITAKGAVIQNTLSLKAYMAVDAAAPFEIETPPVDKIPVEKIADLQPESVYALAMANMPQQKGNDFRIKAAEKNAVVAKAGLYPVISIYGSLGSRYANYLTVPTGFPKSDPFFPQLNENFQQSVGLNLNIPIFNGYIARTNYRRSKITIRNEQLQKELDDQTLKQDIYQAYNAAMIALEKFNAGKKAVEAAERTLNYAQKRYEVGMLSTFELITNQNNLFTVKLQNALNQYDYVFKMKVLEFYKGQGLKF